MPGVPSGRTTTKRSYPLRRWKFTAFNRSPKSG
jgi:hypothetical protein